MFQLGEVQRVGGDGGLFLADEGIARDEAAAVGQDADGAVGMAGRGHDLGGEAVVVQPVAVFQEEVGRKGGEVPQGLLGYLGDGFMQEGENEAEDGRAVMEARHEVLR